MSLLLKDYSLTIKSNDSIALGDCAIECCNSYRVIRIDTNGIGTVLPISFYKSQESAAFDEAIGSIACDGDDIYIATKLYEETDYTLSKYDYTGQFLWSAPMSGFLIDGDFYNPDLQCTSDYIYYRSDDNDSYCAFNQSDGTVSHEVPFPNSADALSWGASGDYVFAIFNSGGSDRIYKGSALTHSHALLSPATNTDYCIIWDDSLIVGGLYRFSLDDLSYTDRFYTAQDDDMKVYPTASGIMYEPDDYQTFQHFGTDRWISLTGWVSLPPGEVGTMNGWATGTPGVTVPDWKLQYLEITDLFFSSYNSTLIVKAKVDGYSSNSHEYVLNITGDLFTYNDLVIDSSLDLYIANQIHNKLIAGDLQDRLYIVSTGWHKANTEIDFDYLGSPISDCTHTAPYLYYYDFHASGYTSTYGSYPGRCLAVRPQSGLYNSYSNCIAVSWSSAPSNPSGIIEIQADETMYIACCDVYGEPTTGTVSQTPYDVYGESTTGYNKYWPSLLSYSFTGFQTLYYL